MTALAFTGTFSKSPLAWGFKADEVITGAQGAHVRLTDGKRYLDWVSGLGSNLLGYGVYHDKFRIAMEGALYNSGAGSLSLEHQLEGEGAERLTELLRRNIGHWRVADLKARFAKTGSEVTTMAVRLARAVTGHYGILTVAGGYHGWNDWTVARSEPAWGVTPTEGA